MNSNYYYGVLASGCDIFHTSGIVLSVLKFPLLYYNGVSTDLSLGRPYTNNES